MFDVLRLWFGLLKRLLRSRQSLLIENLALRQQLAVFKRQNGRPRLVATDKLFWVVLRHFWSLWKNAFANFLYGIHSRTELIDREVAP